MVLKLATTTPLTAIMLSEVLEEADLPLGYLNLVVGPGGAIGNYLVQHPGIKMVTFTGSPAVGEHIRAIAGLKPVVLELASDSGNIVHSDADLDTTARLLSAKAYRSAGQFYISVQRIYVHRPVLAPFNAAFIHYTEALKVGDPLDPTVNVGPLITNEEALRVHGWIKETQEGVFTKGIGPAWKAAQTIEAGGVIINDTSAYRVDLMPYGGVKLSGMGREGPRFALEEMTEIRTVIFNL